MDVLSEWDRYLGDVEAVALDRINGDDYDSGELESMRRTLRNLRESYARLLAYMVDHHGMDADGLSRVLDGHRGGYRFREGKGSEEF